ncbi:retrotransposon protein, putative, ty1-copia subclass [Tanacetum coccineum]
MASPKASISKPSKKPKFTIIPPKQLFIDLTNEDTITPSPKLQESSLSAPNAPSKTPSTKDTSSSSIDYTPKSPTSSTSLSPNGYLNPPTSPSSRFLHHLQSQEKGSMVACLMLGSMTPELHKQFKTFHACKQEEGKPVSAYVLKLKGYVEQLERLGYVLLQDLSVGLILNGFTSDFVEFVRNYNMHNMGKTISKLHALLIEYEKGLPKKDATPQRNCPAYLAELIKKKKQVGTASSSVSKNNVLYFNVIPSNGIYEIDMLNLVPNVNSIHNVSNKRGKHNLDSTYSWHYHLAHISKKCIEKLQHDRLLKSMDEESFDKCVSCLSGKMIRKPFPHCTERATDLLGLIHTDVCGPLRYVSRQGEYISQEFKDYLKACGIVQQLTPPYTPQHNDMSEGRNRTLLDMVRSMMNLTTLGISFWDYALESTTRILNMVPTKKVDKTPYKLWCEKVPNLSYLKVWRCEAFVKRDTPDKLQQTYVKCIFIGYPKETTVSRRAVELEEIQYKDTPPSKNTSEIPMEVEGFKPPQEEVVPVRRSVRIHRAPIHLCMNVEVEEHSLGDLNEPTNYKDSLLDPESDNKTVGSKWLFKKKTDMDGIIHTYKARFVENGFTQTYRVDYEETFSPVADIRVIRILIAITAFYDYEIWQMDVKTAFLNGFLDEDIYMVQLEGAVDWKSSNQSTTVMSATEATYIAASKDAMEVVWIRKLISRLGIVPTINKPIKMFCDNSTALLIANEPGVQREAIHYHRRYHYVRECVVLGEINLLKVHTYDNLVDPFTKALLKGKLTQCARSMGLCLSSNFM